MHGGIMSILLDSAMSGGVLSSLARGQGCSTLQLNVHFVRGVRAGTALLLAEGWVKHVGGKIATAEGQVNGRDRPALRACHHHLYDFRFEGLKESELMAFTSLLVTSNGPITTIVLNRPQVLNALHTPMHFEMQAALDDFAADPERRVCVIRGAGDRAFCAGSDLKYGAAMHDAGQMVGQSYPALRLCRIDRSFRSDKAVDRRGEWFCGRRRF